MKNLSQLSLLLLAVILLCSTQQKDVPHQLPLSVKNYLTKYKYLSVEVNQQTGIPIPIILAVAGLESGWGNSELAINANNHFGIKHKPSWQGSTYCKTTYEYWNTQLYQPTACFRKYPLIRESYQDFGVFITQNDYRHLLNLPSWDYRAWAEGLQRTGYATDPEYANKILRLIWRYHLYEQ